MAQPRFETLLDIFQESTDSFPHRELFGTKKSGRWQWMTYREFGRDVEKIRGGLASLEVGRGDHVACVANNQILDKVRGFLKSIPSLKHIIAMEGGTNGSSGEGITTYRAILDAGKK